MTSNARLTRHVEISTKNAFVEGNATIKALEKPGKSIIVSLGFGIPATIGGSCSVSKIARELRPTQ
jgi:hypothetical protein